MESAAVGKRRRGVGQRASNSVRPSTGGGSTSTSTGDAKTPGTTRSTRGRGRTGFKSAIRSPNQRSLHKFLGLPQSPLKQQINKSSGPFATDDAAEIIDMIPPESPTRSSGAIGPLGLPSPPSEPSSSQEGTETSPMKPKRLWGDDEATRFFGFRDPYYQRVFDEALNVVVEGESYLLDSKELQLASVYTNLPDESKRLFVRLFCRDNKWIKVKSLRYPEISDLCLAAELLCLPEVGLADAEPSDLVELVNILGIGELRKFIKDSRIVLKPLPYAHGKGALVDAVMAHLNTQSLLAGDPRLLAWKRVTALLGPVVRLKADIVEIFERVMIIYFRSLDLEEKPITAGILGTVNKWNFPSYTVNRSDMMWDSRKDCLQYCYALRVQRGILGSIERKDRAAALPLLPCMEQAWYDAVQELTSSPRKSLLFLQFHPARVFTHILTAYTMEILPVLKMHHKAISLLHTLLAQDLVGCGSRGKWWDQLSHLTLHHESDVAQEDREEFCLDLCAAGVRDPMTRAGRLVSIRRRMERIAKRVWERRVLVMEGNEGLEQIADQSGVPIPAGKKRRTKKDKLMLSGWDLLIPRDVKRRLVDLTVREPTEVIFEGLKIGGSSKNRQTAWPAGKPTPQLGIKSRWTPLSDLGMANDDDDQDDLIKSEDILDLPILQGAASASASANVSLTVDVEVSVEALALQHYAQTQGFSGLHIENALFHHLFAILFFDILLTPLPGAFQTRYQTFPLDLYTDEFYTQREDAILARCAEIAGWTSSEFVEEVVQVDARLREKKTMLAGAAWTAMDDPKILEQLAGCMQPSAVAAVMRIMAEGLKEHCGGLPDLVLWKPPVMSDVAAVTTTETNHEDTLFQTHEESRQLEPPRVYATGGTIKFAEVKGPGDRLSEKQIMWLDVLAGTGWDVEVCKVVEQGKGKRKIKTEEPQTDGAKRKGRGKAVLD
ncbi:hypothetical protein DFS34DRAFT_102907 [Phlyctochytrium arcticum]|nr:hypothetical protein DFS34DRAFT_102907 [Phlyctochytrium arcticum]